MEIIKNNAIFDFNENQLSEVRKSIGYGDVTKLNQEDIFEDWIEKQNHFVVTEFARAEARAEARAHLGALERTHCWHQGAEPSALTTNPVTLLRLQLRPTELSYLERFLIFNKGSVERAKRRFDKLCTLRNLLPDVARNFDISNEFLPLFKCTSHCVLPKPTADSYRIIISSVFNAGNHEGAELIHFYRYAVVYIEYMLRHDYVAGIEFVMDNRDMSLGLAAKMNPMVIHKAFTLFEAYGLRLKTLHILSNSKFIDLLVSVMKQGMSAKLGRRIQVHTTLETMYKFIPKDMLPVDYGGKEKSIKELSEDLFTELNSEEHRNVMKRMEEATTDESRRLSSTFNEDYSGIPGSFKSLCVD